jgi:hypothetical protein
MGQAPHRRGQGGAARSRPGVDVLRPAHGACMLGDRAEAERAEAEREEGD